MDRIKANQQKLQPALTTPKTHYQGKFVENSGNKRIKLQIEFKFEFELKFGLKLVSINVSMCVSDLKITPK